MASKSLLLIFVTLASVAAQTFQYSRGWTNGKRSSIQHDWSETRANTDNPWDSRGDNPGYKATGDMPVMHVAPRDIAKRISATLNKISPCQMSKLKYILEGWSLDDEWLYLPCSDADPEDEPEGTKPRKLDAKPRRSEPLYEVFQ